LVTKQKPFAFDGVEKFDILDFCRHEVYTSFEAVFKEIKGRPETS